MRSRAARFLVWGFHLVLRVSKRSGHFKLKILIPDPGAIGNSFLAERDRATCVVTPGAPDRGDGEVRFGPGTIEKCKCGRVPPGSSAQGGDFDFDQGLVLDQGRDLNNTHGGKMLAHDVPINTAHFPKVLQVGAFVSDVPGHSGHVFRASLCRFQHGPDIEQRLPQLPEEIPALESPVGQPANLSAAKDVVLASGHNAIGITLRAGPAFGEEGDMHGAVTFARLGVWSIF